MHATLRGPLCGMLLTSLAKDMAVEAFPHLKEAPLSPGAWMPRHPCLPRSQDKDAISWGVRLSLHGTCGWDVGLACAQGTLKKKSTRGKKKKKVQKKSPKKKNPKRKGPLKKEEGSSAGVLRQ